LFDVFPLIQDLVQPELFELLLETVQRTGWSGRRVGRGGWGGIGHNRRGHVGGYVAGADQGAGGAETGDVQNITNFGFMATFGEDFEQRIESY
jgi:hypothetical protein